MTTAVPQDAPPPDLAPRDEEGELRADFVDAVTQAVEAGDPARTLELLGDLHEADMGAVLEAIEHDLRPRLVELMGREFDFAALTEVEDSVREDILEELPTETIAEGVHELESDDALTILEDLPQEEQEEILEALPALERVALRRSLDYPEGSAGRLMQTSMVTAPPFWTVGQLLDHIHDALGEEAPDSFFDVFVVDPAHRFLGNVFLDRLLRARRSQRLDELMDSERRRVHVDDDQEEVARVFERYNLVSAPVVDEGERLVGMITIDDVVDVIEQEADEDIKALGGVSASEQLSDSVWWTARSRFLWLTVNLVTAFAAAAVISRFEGQIQQMVALAVLVPIVASQGGNAATQTMTVAVRALATRELTSANARRIILREAAVGGLNGLAFGVITGMVAGAWYGLPGLGVVMTLAMITNLVFGALGGILIPMLLEKLDADPAVASSPFVTTVTDVVGNLAFLGFATLYFGLGSA
ncbi:MAG: magnesium transporter [Beijerinckiaceae bacterium]|jgi:magnesium transporter